MLTVLLLVQPALAAGTTAAAAGAVPPTAATPPAAAAAPPTAATAPAAAPAPSHHRGKTFQNRYLDFAPPGLWALMQRQWTVRREGLPLPPRQPTPTAQPDLVLLTANGQAGSSMSPTVTWIGHSTVLAQLGGLTVLTDPVFSDRASPVHWAGPQRAQPPGVAMAQLPRVDVVLISHNHYDHFDETSLRALNAQASGAPLFLVPLGLKSALQAWGIQNVVELDWWQSHRLGAVDFVLTPVQHWSGRSFLDRMQTLWGGWAVFAPDFHLFFAGDSAASRDFRDIRERFAARQRDGGGFDLALLPVGGYEPRWYLQDEQAAPDEAVRLHLDLGAKRSVGIHWGTFPLGDEPLDAPILAVAQARRVMSVPDGDFFLMAIGETRSLPRRPVPAAPQ